MGKRISGTPTYEELEKRVQELEKALRERDEVLDHLPDRVLIQDMNNRIQWANRAACESLKMKRSDLIGLSCHEMWGEDSFPCSECPIPKTLENGKQKSIEKKSPNGGTWRIRCRPLKNSKGDISGIVKVEEDISEAINIRELQRKTEAYRKLILDTMQEMMAYYDTDRRVKWVNKAAADSVGEDADALIGKHCYEVWQQRKTPCEVCPVLEAMKTGKPQENEVTTPDGRIYQIRGFPIYDEIGRLIGAVEYGMDITAAKRAETALRESEAFMRAVFGSTQDLICTRDPQGRLITFNSSFAEFIDKFFQVEATPGMRTMDLLTPDKKEYWDNILEKVMSGEYHREQFAVEVEGIKKWYDLSLSPIVQDGNIIGSVEFTYDITHLKQAQEMLQNSFHELELREKIAKTFLTSPKDRLFSEIIDLICAEFESVNGYMGYFDETGDLICPSIRWGMNFQCPISEKGIVFPVTHWNVGWNKMKNQGSIMKNDNIDPPKDHIPIHNFLAAPLIVNEIMVGQIAVANKSSVYDSDHQKQLESLSEFIAPILKIFLDKENAKTELQAHAIKLREKNIALNVVLENLEEEKRKSADNILNYFDKFVFPYYGKLKNCQKKEDLSTILNIIETNTRESLSPLKGSVSSIYRTFTPMEIQVADLIKAGKTSKEIADILNISLRSVFFHRNNIRKKLNINHTKANLRSSLASLP